MTLAISMAVLLAALLHASWNAMIKGGGDVLLDTAGIVFGAMLVTLPFLFVVPFPVAAAWPYIVASVTVHLAYYWLMVSAYRAGDLSLVYPLMRGVAPLITAVAGIAVLGELPPAIAWAGMLLISAGVFALSFRALGHAPSRVAVGFALANAAVIALYTLIDGLGVRAAGNAASYVATLFVFEGVPYLALVLWRRRAEIDATLAHMAGRWKLALAGTAASFGSYAIALWAMTQAPVALVASLRETSVLFATLIGARLLHERLTARRWSGVLAVVLGVLALKAA